MSGRAIIIVVTGIIIISSVIFYNIEAASTTITANFNGYYLRQSAQNISQTGVNMALRQLGYNRTWRTGFPLRDALGGKVIVATLLDTTYAGSPCVKIQSTGISSYGTSLETRAVATVLANFPPSTVPIAMKAAITLRGSNQVSNNCTIDGRDHNSFSTAVNAKLGTWGVWSTGPTLTQAANTKIGGTKLDSTDVAPVTSPADSAVIRLNQVYSGGYPTTPDSILGGVAAGYSNGTLKALAQTGVAGSQYVTDPGQLKFPLSGITYVEMPTTSPANRWNASNVNGTGIIVCHNGSTNAIMDNANGSFAGLVIGDDVTHLHGDFWGAIMLLSPTPSGNVLGNGNANIYYSRQAILNATSLVSNGTQPNVIVWWE